MASKDPFNIAMSPAVASIPCIGCGNNMHCVRRQPMDEGERQLFMCATCGGTRERIFGAQASDHEIEILAEVTTGLKPA